MDEPQYCDVCCLRICAGRCGCSSWHKDTEGIYRRIGQPPEVLVRMIGDSGPTTPDVMLSRLMRKCSQAILETQE